MSKGNGNSNKLPKAPSPQNASYSQNGVLQSTSIWNPKTNTYETNSFTTPQQQSIENNANDYMSTLIKQLPDKLNLSQESIDKYGDAYAAPQIAALNSSYNEAKGNAAMSASGAGLTNSVGFADYQANKLAKQQAQGLADIQSNKMMQQYNLPNQILSPYVNQFNLLNAAASGQQASMNQNLAPSVNQAQLADNFALQNFQNQLSQYTTQRKNGLFGFLTGG